MHIRPVSIPVGAEITGIDVGNLDEPDFTQIHDAFLKHHLLVFRDQDLPPLYVIAIGF